MKNDQKSLKLLAISQLLLIIGLVTTGISLIAVTANYSAWLGLGLGVIGSVLGVRLLKTALKHDRSALTNAVAKQVVQRNLLKVVGGLGTAIAGLLMIGIGLVMTFAAKAIWLRLCLLGLVALVTGIILMQGEVRRIIDALRRSEPPHAK